MSGHIHNFFGIDVGAETLHVASSYVITAPVFEISLQDPLWYKRLTEMIAPGDTVALEPTGWHYAAPVIGLLKQIGADVLLVDHRTTQHARNLKVSGVKNDRTDAKALCFIATNMQRDSFLGVTMINPEIQQSAMSLRMLIWSFMRADKERTRSINRLRQLAHSTFPYLDFELKTYLHAVYAGAPTPAAMHALAHELKLIDAVPRLKDRAYPEAYRTPSKRAALYAMVDAVPVWAGNDTLAQVITIEAGIYADANPRAERLREQIEAIAVQPPFGEITALWMTMPGVGLTLCATLHAATRGLAACLPPEQFRSSVGSHPRRSESGAKRESRKSLNGFRPAKRSLHLAMMGMISKRDNAVAEAFAYYKTRGDKYAMQKARAKLVNILSGIARSGKPYDPAIAGREGVR